MKWIIDGNNLIHADPELRQRMGESGYPAAVQLLCHELNRAAARGDHFVLCLDSGAGTIPPGTSGPQLEVHVAEHGSTADDLILLLIQREESQKHIEVVTNDFKDIGKRLPGGHVQHCSCSSFRQRALSTKSTKKSANPGGQSGGKPAPPRSKKQIDYWLDQFSDEEGS